MASNGYFCFSSEVNKATKCKAKARLSKVKVILITL